jgi:Sugar (and other) transporter
LLPESPRYLISKDRDDEAFEILVKYHAEGDRDSVFVRAEMAQIKTTIKTELEYAKQSWFDMLKTSGMRKRVYIASMIGLFAQWSGNTLLSYYLSDILDMMGWTTIYAKTRINGMFTLTSVDTFHCHSIGKRKLTLDMYSIPELLGFHQWDNRFTRRDEISTSKDVFNQSHRHAFSLHWSHNGSSTIPSS